MHSLFKTSETWLQNNRESQFLQFQDRKLLERSSYKCYRSWQSTLSKVDSKSTALTYVSVLMWTISGRRLRMEWISQQAFGLQQTDADDDDDNQRQNLVPDETGTRSVWQTRHKSEPHFGSRSMAPFSGTCVMGLRRVDGKWSTGLIGCVHNQQPDRSD